VTFMNIKLLITILLLSFGFAASAENTVISMAYEIYLSNFRAPVTANGGVTFKECEQCEQRSVRVTPDTRYAINGKAVRLEDFRKAVSQADDRDETVVIVLHHLESNTVESLNVSI